jgi:hypothetical protein
LKIIGSKLTCLGSRTITCRENLAVIQARDLILQASIEVARHCEINELNRDQLQTHHLAPHLADFLSICVATQLLPNCLKLEVPLVNFLRSTALHRLPTHFSTFQDVPTCSKMFQDVPGLLYTTD